VDKLLSGRIALEDINAAFDCLNAAEVVRQIIEFSA
jgi:Zn-dependent alcohol dehydrogenase